MPHISGPVLTFFRKIVQRYFRRQFRAVRVSGAARFADLRDERLIVYANHSSWWDPMVCVLLAGELMPMRDHFAPMDAAALERYSILKRVGIFGVEMQTARGAVQFLRTGLALLEQHGVLWITPQGRFADPRERPLNFKPGLAALAAKVKGGCTVLPLAIEYVFWDERLPETLLHFGEPVRVDGKPADQFETFLEDALERTMDELRMMAIARNAAPFELVQRGRVGAGGFYEIGQRLLARLRGRSYQAEHTATLSRSKDVRG